MSASLLDLPLPPAQYAPRLLLIAAEGFTKRATIKKNLSSGLHNIDVDVIYRRSADLGHPHAFHFSEDVLHTVQCTRFAIFFRGFVSERTNLFLRMIAFWTTYIPRDVLPAGTARVHFASSPSLARG